MNSILEFKRLFLEYKDKYEVLKRILSEMKGIRVEIDELRKKRLEMF